MHRIKVLDCLSAAVWWGWTCRYLLERCPRYFFASLKKGLWGIYSRNCELIFKFFSFCMSIPKTRSSVLFVYHKNVRCHILSTIIMLDVTSCFLHTHNKDIAQPSLCWNCDSMLNIYIHCIIVATLQYSNENDLFLLFIFCFLMAKFFNEARAGKVGGRGR